MHDDEIDDEKEEGERDSKPDKKHDGDRKIIEAAIEFHERCEEAERDKRLKAREALEFCSGEQWPSEVRRQREAEGRPCLTLDKVNQYTRQITNDIRQSIPQIKIAPSDSGADRRTADILDGIVRSIERRSVAPNAYKMAVEHAIQTGEGFLRVINEFEGNSKNQTLRITGVSNRFSVFLDPDAEQRNGQDAREALIVSAMSRKAFKRKFPKADDMDFESGLWTDNAWVEKDSVMTAEYFRLMETPDEDGGNSIPTCEWMRLSASEVLERTVIPTRYIPIVRVVGNVLEKDGVTEITGAVTSAMEGARMYNYAASAFVENVALAPTAPFIAADGQIEKYKASWQVANRKNVGALPYTPMSVGNVLVPPPQRQPPPGLSEGWMVAMQKAEGDIQSSFGMYPASLGAQSNETAGVAINARRSESDTVNYHYADNLADAVRQVGVIIVDMLPQLISDPRDMRILAEDGKVGFVRMDPNMQTPFAMNMDMPVINPAIGAYDVDVRVGPSFSTRRQEASEWMMSMVSASPQLMPIVGDIMFRYSDHPGAEQMADRLEMALPPELRGQGEDMQLPPPVIAELEKRGQMLDQAMQKIGELEAALKDKTDAARIEAQVKLETEAMRQEGETRRSLFDSEAEMERVIVQETGRVLASQVANADERAQQLRLAMQLADPAERLAALEQLAIETR